MGKVMAIRYAKALTSNYPGSFDTVDADLEAGAQHCLGFLASNVGGGAETVQHSAQMSALQPPFVEERLGERLRDLLDRLCTAGYDWRWEVDEDEMTARVDRVFMVSGVSRTGGLVSEPEIIMIPPLGQQHVMPFNRMTVFRDGRMSEKLEAYEELMMADMVLVADVTVKTSQRWGFRQPEEKSSSSFSLDSEKVEHVLRLEMALPQVGGSDMPNKRVSSWQLADWNWLCNGNHPALKKGKRAPW